MPRMARDPSPRPLSARTSSQLHAEDQEEAGMPAERARSGFPSGVGKLPRISGGFEIPVVKEASPPGMTVKRMAAFQTTHHRGRHIGDRYRFSEHRGIDTVRLDGVLMVTVLGTHLIETGDRGAGSSEGRYRKARKQCRGAGEQQGKQQSHSCQAQ